MVLCSTMVPQFTQTTRESLLSSSRPPHAGHAPLDDMMNTTSRSHHVVNLTTRGGGGNSPHTGASPPDVWPLLKSDSAHGGMG